MDFFAQRNAWSSCSTERFWSQLLPGDHVVNIYDDELSNLGLVENFVASSLRGNESVIVIGTVDRIRRLEVILSDLGFNIFNLKLKDQLIICDVERMLDMFMIDGWPDEVLFQYMITTLAARARRTSTNIRLFGEMASILWRKGFKAATIQLEHLCGKICAVEKIQTLCCYPEQDLENGFHSTMAICEHHSRVIKSRKFRPSELMVLEKDAMNLIEPERD